MFNIISKALHFACRCRNAAVGRFWAAYYTMRYNHGGNVFICHAKLLNCKVNIHGTGHRIQIMGGGEKFITPVLKSQAVETRL